MFQNVTQMPQTRFRPFFICRLQPNTTKTHRRRLNEADCNNGSKKRLTGMYKTKKLGEIEWAFDQA
jgi:hypothetical protein